MTAILLALGAGLAYAAASVLQQRAAASQAHELALRFRLLAALARRPLWLLGTAFDVVAFGLEAAALGSGHVSLVAPLLVSGLLFALPLAALGTGRRLSRRDWSTALLLTASLAVFVTVASPTGGASHAGWSRWVPAFVVIGAVSVAGAVVAMRRVDARRAFALGVVTGVLYGLTALLTKSAVDALDVGVGTLLGRWELYALLVVSALALVVNQSAFQAGHLAASLPALSVVHPFVAAVLGILVFGERLDVSSAGGWVLTALSVVAMAGSTIALARSPLVASPDVPVHPAPAPQPS